jgi:hypothetical protein
MMTFKKRLQKIVCFTLSALLVWTSSYAIFADQPERLTLQDLKERYPHAELISVSPEDFRLARSRFKDHSIMIVQVDEGINDSTNETDRLPYTLTTADKIMARYPKASFEGVRLQSYQVGDTFFNTHILLVAKPRAIFVAENEAIPSLEAIKQKYPDTIYKLYHIRSQAAFRKLQSQADSSVVFIARLQTGTKTRSSTEVIYPPAPDDIQVTGSCIADLSDLTDDNLAVVIFVVVGIFIVAALFIYAGKFIYDIAVGNKQYDYWWEIGPGITVIENDVKYGFKEKGSLVGLKLSTGFTDRGIQFGLTGEAGFMDFTLYFEDKQGLHELEGLYGMAGPAIRFLFYDDRRSPNPSYLYLELLAGTSEHEEAGLLSVARMGVNWRMTKYLRLGIHVGSLYFDLKESEGIITEEDNFRLMGGMEFGFRF